MSFIADGHIHLYPNFDLNQVLVSSHKKLLDLAQTDKVVLFSVEPEGQFEFLNIKSGKRELPENCEIIKEVGENVIQLKTEHGDNLYLVAGRQVVTKENLEFSVLFSTEDILDGLSFEQLNSSIGSSVLTLNWSPGKWMFERAEVVKKLVDENPDLILCDTALRFTGFPLPEVMKLENNIIAGSDPFPLQDEEQRTGSYGFISKSNLDFKEAILEGDLEIIGKRLNAVEVAKKLFSLKKEKLNKKFKKKSSDFSVPSQLFY